MATLQHTSTITLRLMAGPTCVDCLAVACNTAPTEVDRHLATIAKSLEVTQHHGRCAACGQAAAVWSLTRS
jgi:hypothetical protein